jgi:hypothetical protein
MEHECSVPCSEQQVTGTCPLLRRISGLKKGKNNKFRENYIIKSFMM